MPEKLPFPECGEISKTLYELVTKYNNSPNFIIGISTDPGSINKICAMTAIDNNELQNRVNAIIAGFEKSMLPVKHFTLMFPFGSPSGIQYTVTIVAIINPGEKVFNYSVIAREFIKA